MILRVNMVDTKISRFNEYNIAWLTLNRACNLRCYWCYAKSTRYSSNEVMSSSDAKFAIDIIASFGIKKIILIGGEPTIHKDICTIISYIQNKGITPVIATNGLRLVDDDFFEFLEANSISTSISLKSCSKEDYIKDTQIDCFNDIQFVVNKVINSSIPYDFSYVINEENIDNLFETLSLFYFMGIKYIGLSLCYSSPGNVIKYNIWDMVNKFVSLYPKINTIGIEYNFLASLPLCLYPDEFISEAASRGQLSTICQMQTKSGLIFDTNLDILACNSLYEYPIVKKDEYADHISLKQILNSEKIINMYKKLLRLPSKRCSSCKYVRNCGGGCVLTWQDFSLDNLLSEKQ